MSILVSGVLMDPAGRPISEAQITLTAIANSLSVLNGFSATVETDSAGHYGITLAVGSYSIGIAAEGRNHIYGAITLDDTTGPSTLNQLLKQQIMESEVTPGVILYFRQIQQQVANDLSTVKVLEGRATDAAGSASASRDAAQQYATGLAEAVASAKAYRDQAERDAVTATLGAASATLSKDAATVSQQASAQSENNARQYRDEAKQAATTAAEDASTRAAQQAVDKVAGQVKADADRAVQGASTAQEVKRSVDLTAQRVTQQHGEAVQAASNAKASETHAANSAGTATNAAGTAVVAKDEAAGSAQNAANSAGGSQVSATQAAGSAGAAAGSAVTAKQEADRATAASEGKLDKTGGELSGGLKISGLFAAATPGANGYPTQLALAGSGGISNQSGGNNGVGFHDDGNTYFWNRKGNVTDYNVIMAPTETTFKKPIVGNSSITSGAQIIVAPQTAESYSAIWLRKPGNSDNACQLTYDKGDKFFISTPTSFHRFSTDCIALVDTRTVTGSDGGLIKGSVQVSTSYSTWRERAAGIMIDTPFDNATSVQNVFKVTRWGAEHIAGMQVHASPTTSAITMNFRNNAQHVFAENGSISTTSPTIIGERVLSYNGDIYGTAWGVGGNPGWLTAKLAQTRNTSNTTVDANGFIKAASPVIRLFNNSRFDDVAYYSVPEGFTPAGSGAVNSEAKGVMAERVSEGVYQVTGAQGFAIDGWQIELPTDDNRQPLIWAEREVDEAGVITIRTYHREHLNSPPFAQNKRDGYSDGQAVDIPHGRWVDLRLEMDEVKLSPVG
ncbi:prophage tail fiber N-terminal domain-containing protein [Yersinia ruckeri]|uniref:phage tail fiber protein n=1 Tax=Yersinia ruckeri TaxID=29486 RepID=UPI000BDF252A|nr:prophage tail fiber N-terminal domain-containing protein [Yersinia ruckeri]MCK8538244.1 prophage tail fiber N-terminal domain-containing protein [Yersinia ruckeri]MCK8569990.1 prophage tail fiber N-terminal domain-containing protein [Yersinia ruckeri]MCK8573927.1 prophage tail fiber N-terminal domain-containing protein [Yersinia ruckeri]MCK8576708.1 prophage tail fiber N-terminal domain-containing protein [Yersinia ruckeri]MCK8580118.1 prophage tail fiber N-terminal domain-containing protei